MDPSARLEAWIRTKGVDARVERFAASCHTVQEAAAAAGAPLERIVKTICLVAQDGRLVAAVVMGLDRADRARVQEALGLPARPRLATGEEMLARTGFPAGGTPPFAFDAAFLVDERVLALDEVWAGGGSDRALVRVAPREMLRANGGTVARVRA